MARGLPGTDGPYLDDSLAEYFLSLLNGALFDIDVSTKADLDSNNLVFRAEIPKSNNADPSTVADRRATGTLAVALATLVDEAVRLDQMQAAVAASIGTVPDVRDLRVTTTTLIAADATTQISVPQLDLTGAKTGDIWKISYALIVESSQNGGINVRFRNGTAGLVTTANYVITGYWGPGPSTVAAPVSNNHSKMETITYPTAHPAGGGSNLTGGFGGIGVGVLAKSIVAGEFEISIPTGALVAQTIGLEFTQRVLDAPNPTRVCPGSFLSAVQLV